MMEAVKGFNGQLERIAELVVVMVTGAMLSYTYVPSRAVWFLLLLILFARPVSVWLGLLGASSVRRAERILISWFGIRGVGSIYYLMYAINHGLSEPLAKEVMAITLTTVAASVVLHGISVTPLMRRYARQRRNVGIERQRGPARVNPSATGNGYRVDDAIAFRLLPVLPGYAPADGKICHGTSFARSEVRGSSKLGDRDARITPGGAMNDNYRPHAAWEAIEEEDQRQGAPIEKRTVAMIAAALVVLPFVLYAGAAFSFRCLSACS